MQTVDQVVNVTWHDHADAMHAFQKVEDPPPGRPLRGLMQVVRPGLMSSRQWLV
jgi:hypothetical protein